MTANYKNKKPKVYTPTQVNNYNKFLKSLDDEQKTNDLLGKELVEFLNKPIENDEKNYSQNENILEKKTNVKLAEEAREREREREREKEKEKQMQNILNLLSEAFKSYDTTCFTGSRLCDNKTISDPNKFDSETKIVKLPENLIKKKTIKSVYDGPKEKKDIFVEINSISDLLKLVDDYKLDEKIEYNINLELMHNIKDPLIELNNMIGMRELKENIVDQILYFSQNLHKSSNGNEVSGDYMHTVLYGPPGTGKTEVARIMGKIYSKMGTLKKGCFKKVTRSDLIAGYLGQTALKTKEAINDSLGGVLFIDEAYALGNNEKKDSFSKECIDTLCEALSANKDNLMVIIAGYENELKDCFFSFNQGLESRFTWRFKTEEYNAKDLHAIFIKKVRDIGWSIDSDSEKNINASWFEKKLPYFKFFGRDIEVFLSKVKIVHGRRVFCKTATEKTKITFQDLEKGFELYLKNDEVKKRKDDAGIKFALSSMYL
jgi:ATP-dependent 26S proteasome regulatory subunit